MVFKRLVCIEADGEVGETQTNKMGWRDDSVDKSTAISEVLSSSLKNLILEPDVLFWRTDGALIHKINK